LHNSETLLCWRQVEPASIFILCFICGCLPISKEVNRKKESEVEGACGAPVNGDDHHFTKINYLYTF
uniref:Neuronal regeneration-related protein n=1 Tax=Phasianus colchicus TaxID=9054 RepID=A0A669QJ08_PHACC